MFAWRGKKPQAALWGGVLAALALTGAQLPAIVLPASLEQRALASALLTLLTALPVGVVLVLASRASARQNTGAQASWRLFATGQWLVVAGDIIWAYIELVERRSPSPSAADIFFAAAYPCLFAGVVLLPKERPGWGVRLRTLVDTGTVMLAACFLWWVLILGPQIARNASDLPAVLLAAIYPVIDLGLAWALMEAMARKFDPRERIPALVLAAGIVMQILSDMAFSFKLFDGNYVSGQISDAGYAISTLLLGLAGWLRIVLPSSAVDVTNPPEPITRTLRIVDYLPYTGAGLAYVALIAGHDRQPLAGFASLAAGTGVLTGLVLLRQWLAGRDVARLYAGLQAGESRYRAIVECQTDLMLRWYPDGTPTYMNDAFVRYFPESREELMHQKMYDVFASEEDHALADGLLRATPGSPGFETQICIETPGGGPRYVQWQHVALFERARLVEVQSVGRDVTERELARQALETLKQELEERVRQRTAELEAEVAERRHAQDELASYAARLERSNRELESFAYVSSHDLQEPLRKIQAFGDRLRDRYGDVLDDQGRDYLSRMQSAAARMQALIDGLLTYSRVTTRGQPFVSVNLNRVAHEVLLDLETRIATVNGTIEMGELPVIEADPLQIRQLLQNLIANALKFYRVGVPPVVRISGERLAASRTAADGDELGPLPERCVLRVEDNGIGFDEKYGERIFQVFQRLHGRGVYDGAGIGLSVCRKIAERHNGTIIARSAPGEGSTFIVTLPVRQAQDEKIAA